ncbi:MULTISPECIES: YcxB family protein [unclassified Streptomyces]|uniref:YcxB family protein n=1 Tax=unclassified Streptomyces TaxID=2593676 RepID=UPI002365130E|nr:MULTISPECIES: YcxB family protein [unclassified Streptomyces]MDF3141102.1 YcxB family protein [Streptomyces sp. T21Q-yed]WDF37937.1 YcxB family protein [Streptomyces sp. T12]
MDHQGRDIIQDADAVELAYRPSRGDFLRAVLVRERIRRLNLLRWALVALFASLAVTQAMSGWSSSVLFGALCAVMIWGIPHLQAHHGLRTVSWQGDYRTTVTETGVTTVTDHVTLAQRWSVFRGYRETRDHLVLLSRDPNILLVEVLPKRGAADPADIDRLRMLLGRHLPRV